jgi:hypothetical protein
LVGRHLALRFRGTLAYLFGKQSGDNEEVSMMWAFTVSNLAFIAACNLSALTGVIERIRAPRPHRIDGELIDAFDLRFFQNAPCRGAHGAKSNDGNDTQRRGNSLDASAFLACSLAPGGLDALWMLPQGQGEEIRQAHEPLTANQSVRHGDSYDRQARRRRGAYPQRPVHKSPVIRLSFKNRRRAF